MINAVIELANVGDSVTIRCAHDEAVRPVTPPPFDDVGLPFWFLLTRKVDLYSAPGGAHLLPRTGETGTRVDVSEIRNVEGDKWYRVYKSGNAELWMKKDWL